MEVEFLSNMRYSLFVSDKEWTGWHTTLGRFWAFWDKAQRVPMEVGCRISVPITPTLPVVPPSLPSPPPSNSSSPPFYQLGVPSLMPAHSPVTPMPQPDFQSPSRKRPYEPVVGMQPPSKRVTRSMAPMLTNSGAQYPLLTPLSTPTNNMNVPRLSIDIFPSSSISQHQPAPAVLSNQLPLPGTRAMASVYSHPTPQISPVSTGPINHNMNYNSQSRNTSPYSQHNSIHHSAASSPTTPGFSQHSPNWILGNRNSPYRPVRGVNTLLVPPPSTSAQPPVLAYDQMHYQPLGKSRTEYKTGVVPYLQTEVWPQVWPVPYTDFSF